MKFCIQRHSSQQHTGHKPYTLLCSSKDTISTIKLEVIFFISITPTNTCVHKHNKRFQRTAPSAKPLNQALCLLNKFVSLNGHSILQSGSYSSKSVSPGASASRSRSHSSMNKSMSSGFTQPSASISGRISRDCEGVQ